MPAAGRKPNQGEPIRHRVKPVHDWLEVPDVRFAGGPALPKTQPGQPSWPTQTRRWWAAISTMPHCALWGQEDWAFAIDTAYISAEFHRGDMKAATELRQREKVMGTTLDARRDLRIRYAPPAPDEERPGVVAIEEYRQRLVMVPAAAMPPTVARARRAARPKARAKKRRRTRSEGQ